MMNITAELLLSTALFQEYSFFRKASCLGLGHAFLFADAVAEYPASDPMAPAYVKGRKIGRGSFGTVYVGTSSNSGETVVIKEVELRGLSGKDLKASVAEVGVLKNLRHANIIAYKDSYKDKSSGTLSIVMEYASGGDLGSMITRRAKQGKRFSEEEVRHIFAQCVSALEYCHHKCHLLHRDLKPENIFMSSTGDVKIGDFGISRTLTSTNAQVKTQCGTPLFMSPELAGGKPYSVDADVWAMGCVIYALMTLKQPWADRVGPRGGMMALMKLITNGRLDMTEPRQHYSAEMVKAMESMLARPASERPSFKALLATSLVQSGLTLHATGHGSELAPKPRPSTAGGQMQPSPPHKEQKQPPPLPRVEVKVEPSPPPKNCAPPRYSVARAHGPHTPATLTFGAVPPLPAPRRVHAAKVLPTGQDNAVEAFGADAHVAAQVVQRSHRQRKRMEQVARAGPHKVHPAPRVGHAAAAMAKIDGLLGEVRAARDDARRASPAAPTPPPKHAYALAAQRRELAAQREAEEAALRRQREQYEALDAERKAQRAANSKQPLKPR